MARHQVSVAELVVRRAAGGGLSGTVSGVSDLLVRKAGAVRDTKRAA